jgi:hypothetical protein
MGRGPTTSVASGEPSVNAPVDPNREKENAARSLEQRVMVEAANLLTDHSNYLHSLWVTISYLMPPRSLKNSA